MTTASPADRWAGLGTILRLDLRRERLPLIIWVLALAGTVVSSVSAIAALYPAESDRIRLAGSIAANPAFLALNGPVSATSIGGVTGWRVGVLGGALVGLMAAITVVRRTRADEETGRSELLASGVLGRDSALTAALLTAGGASLLVGGLGAAGATAGGQPMAGSLALGAALAGPGLVFAGVAAVWAQIFSSARAATAAAGATLAVAFGLRAAGDLAGGAGWLVWLSPLGWVERVGAFGPDRWWVLSLPMLSTAALAGVASFVSHRRDPGAGVLPARLGAADNPRLGSALGLAVRLQGPTWCGWAVGFVLLGLVTGSLAISAGNLLTDNPQIEQLMAELGGHGSPSGELLAAMGGICALVAAAYAVSAARRLREEETTGRAELALATAMSRQRWAGSHLLFATAGSAALLLCAGLAAGVVFGAGSDDFWTGLGQALAALTAPIPAVLVLAALAFLLIGWAPGLSGAAWGALGLAVLFGQLGALLGLPRLVVDLSPFTHVPALPTAPMVWLPEVLLVLVAVLVVVTGLVGLGRRDMG